MTIRFGGAGGPWSQSELDRIQQAGIEAALQRPEGQRLSGLADEFLASDRLPTGDPLRAGIQHFVRRRLLDPHLARSAGGLIEHLKVASGARQGMPVFDMRKDTSPNHAETIVLGFEALAHLEKVGAKGSLTRDLRSLLHPAQGNFRKGKDDAEYVRQVAHTAISALEISDQLSSRGF